MSVWGSAPRPGRFTPGKDLVPIVQESGWAPEPVWTCEQNLAPTPGFDPPDRPARSVVAITTELPRPPRERERGSRYVFFSSPQRPDQRCGRFFFLPLARYLAPKCQPDISLSCDVVTKREICITSRT
jgi:hypothetical protein